MHPVHLRLRLSLLAPFLAFSLIACGDDAVSPGDDDPPDRWVSVATGRAHACALSEDGRAFCWGAGERGQLGDGSMTGSVVPVPVSGTDRFETLDAGGDRTCGVTADGATLCWGENEVGQLGDGGGFALPEPTPLEVDPGLATLSAGPFLACGLDEGGRLFCWGGTRMGAVFGGEAPEECLMTSGPRFWRCARSPVEPFPDLRMDQVSVGLYHLCGRTAAGEAVCWGENRFLQLGTTDSDVCENQGVEFPCSLEPSVVPAPQPLGSPVAGANHTCSLSSTLRCWGADVLDFGQLGRGDRPAGAEPEAVVGSASFRQVAPTRENHIHVFTCGVTTDDRALCWGANTEGQLGTTVAGTCGGGDIPCSRSPVEVDGGASYASVSASSRFACALTTSGEVHCWGLNDEGQLGDGTNQGRSAPGGIADPVVGGE